MSGIISTKGYIKPIINIVISKVLDDGTIQHIDHELKIGNTYRFLVSNNKDGMIYEVIGKLKSAKKYPNNLKKDVIDQLQIDTSKEKHSDIVNIMINNIKFIDKIKDFE